MKIAFKNGNEYEVQNLLEQKVFNNASSGWVIGFTFTAKAYNDFFKIIHS